MTTSKLSMLLTVLERTSGAITVRELARKLDISQGRVESMLDYWISKGKIKNSTSQTVCGNCSELGDCPYILEMPRTYELVSEGVGEVIGIVQPACK